MGLRPTPGPTRGSRAWDPHPGSVARGAPFAPLRFLAGAPCAPNGTYASSFYSSRPGRVGASDAIYERTAHPYYKVVADGTRHLDVTDMVFWPALRERKILGTAAPDVVTANTRAVVQEFFDQELLGRRSTILSGRRRLPGVTVTRHEGSVAAPK